MQDENDKVEDSTKSKRVKLKVRVLVNHTKGASNRYAIELCKRTSLRLILDTRQYLYK